MLALSGNGKIAMQNDKKRRFLSIGTVVVAVLLIIALIFLFLQLRIGRSLLSTLCGGSRTVTTYLRLFKA